MTEITLTLPPAFQKTFDGIEHDRSWSSRRTLNFDLTTSDSIPTLDEWHIIQKRLKEVSPKHLLLKFKKLSREEVQEILTSISTVGATSISAEFLSESSGEQNADEMVAMYKEFMEPLDKEKYLCTVSCNKRSETLLFVRIGIALR